MREVVIVGAVRTAIGKFGGALAGVPAPELGSVVIGAALRRAGVTPCDVNEVIMGQVLQAGCGLNAARQAALKAGLPVAVPAYTVNKVCASGMKAVALGALAVAAGESDVVVAGGMENMSAAPFLLPQARWGCRLGDGAVLDAILSEALTDPTEHCHMGITAEHLAAECHVSRQAQDAFAAQSQQRAGAALKAGRFAAEIVSVEIPQRKGPPLRFETDEYPRPDTTAEALAALRPAFKKDGTVTAGNASGIVDGAAMVVVTTSAQAADRGLQPLGRLVSWGTVGVDPDLMGIGPAPAIRQALQRAGLELRAMDLFEINEAFAAQTLSVARELGIDLDRLNVNGGAIAIGHPLAATGARLTLTLLYELRRRNQRYGVAAMCIGGGQGLAAIVENLN